MFLINEKPSDYFRYDGLKIEDGKAKRSTLSESNKDDFDYYASNQWEFYFLATKKNKTRIITRLGRVAISAICWTISSIMRTLG